VPAFRPLEQTFASTVVWPQLLHKPGRGSAPPRAGRCLALALLLEEPPDGRLVWSSGAAGVSGGGGGGDSWGAAATAGALLLLLLVLLLVVARCLNCRLKNPRAPHILQEPNFHE
jgi:hypothetical protein